MMIKGVETVIGPSRIDNLKYVAKTLHNVTKIYQVTQANLSNDGQPPTH